MVLWIVVFYLSSIWYFFVILNILKKWSLVVAENIFFTDFSAMICRLLFQLHCVMLNSLPLNLFILNSQYFEQIIKLRELILLLCTFVYYKEILNWETLTLYCRVTVLVFVRIKLLVIDLTDISRVKAISGIGVMASVSVSNQAKGHVLVSVWQKWCQTPPILGLYYTLTCPRN